MTKRATNILLVFADDLGAWALGAAGNREIITPHLDALAARGIRFENFFCTSPVCSPARASMLTGRIPSQHGVHDWISEGNAGPERIDFLAGQPMLADVLSAHGYRCGLVGKWHLGASDQPRPAYDHWFAHEKGGGPYFGAAMYRGSDLEKSPGYITDVIADDAIDFLREASADARPFFLNVSFTAPHHPWVDAHPDDLVELYADTPFDSIPTEPTHPWMRSNSGETDEAVANPRPSLIGYFAAVTGLDRALGRILSALDDLELTDDTLIAFVGDNGFNTGHHGIWGKGNGTFPQNMYDTSVKVPAIFAHRGSIREGVVSESLLSGYDLMPTLLDCVGLTPPMDAQLPGRSFSAALADPHARPRGHVVVFDEYGPVRMIRSAEWKYVHRVPDGPHELYDLAADPGERNNLVESADHAEQVQSLRTQLHEWFATYAIPEHDGAAAGVTGLGQRGLMGDGGEAFVGVQRTLTVDTQLPHRSRRGLIDGPGM